MDLNQALKQIQKFNCEEYVRSNLQVIDLNFFQVANALKKLDAKYVYIAADGDDMISKFQKKFKKVKNLKI